MKTRSYAVRTVCLASLLCFLAETAHAYVGPGAGLSAIGAFFAVVTAAVASVLGFVWYPIKRLWRRRNRTDQDRNE